MSRVEIEFVPVDGKHSGRWWCPWLDLWATTGQGPEWLPWNVHRLRLQNAETPQVQARAMGEIVALPVPGRPIRLIGRRIRRALNGPARPAPQFSHYLGLDGVWREKWWLDPDYNQPVRRALGPAPLVGVIVDSGIGPQRHPRR